MILDFTLDNIEHLDFGRIKVAFDAARARVVKDCQDRPGESKPRTVQIKFNFYPVSSDASCVDCDEIKVECEINDGVPIRRTKLYVMKPQRDGNLKFNADDPELPDQEMIFDEAERKANNGK